MANCPNCGAKLSCGCQRKTASDGKQGCVQCIPGYEAKLKDKTLNVKRETLHVRRETGNGKHFGV